MGSGESVRATHFQRPEASAHAADDELPHDHHNIISISNKMVERLVEDAMLTSGIDTGASNPRGDFKEKMFIEKLQSLDENHTERFGYVQYLRLPSGTVDTIEFYGTLNAILKRVEMRTANMVGVEPVCADVKRRIIECYDRASSPPEVVHCWDTIGAFTECVQAAGARRLQARSERDAIELERRTRHVAHAREHALKDLS